MQQDERWHIQILNVSEMEMVEDETVSDDDLMRRVLPTDHRIWSEVFDTEERAGISFDFSIDEISDNVDFVVHYLRQAMGEQFDIEKEEPTAHNDVERGHPDFVVTNTENGRTTYVELKKNGDSLSHAQLEWMFDAVLDGENVWIMWVRDTEKRGIRR